MKVSLFLVLLLAAFACGGKKKKTKFNVNIYLQNFMRTPKPTTSIPTTAAQTAPTVNSPLFTGKVKKSFNMLDIKSDAELLKLLNLTLPDGNNSQGGSQGGSSAGDGVCSALHCALRPEVVKLKDPGFGFFYYPPCALVKRCSGCCNSRKLSCKPTSKQNKIFKPYMINIGMSIQSMAVLAGSSFSVYRKKIELEDHLGCACQCTNSPQSCNPKIHTWNAGICDCVCKKTIKCSGNLKFDRTLCACVCAKIKENCGYDRMWSKADCGCVCKPKSCPRHTYLDPRSCNCNPFRGKK